MDAPGTRAVGFLKELRRRASHDAATDRAAQLSYYFVFALFPFLFFLVTLAAYLPLQGALDQLLARLQPLMPEQAMKIIGDQLRALITQQRPNFLTLSLALSLWSASRALDALRTALNLAYGAKESRPFWKTQGMAILLTVLTSALMLTAVAALALGGSAGLWLAERMHLDRFWPLLWGWLRWPLTALGVMFMFSLVYRLLPDVPQSWRSTMPGAACGTILWLLASWGFSIYAAHFGSYARTYGSIGGAIVLLTWLYLTGLIFVLGGEINALLERRPGSVR
jgi:membrane protein